MLIKWSLKYILNIFPSGFSGFHKQTFHYFGEIEPEVKIIQFQLNIKCFIFFSFVVKMFDLHNRKKDHKLKVDVWGFWSCCVFVDDFCRADWMLCVFKLIGWFPWKRVCIPSPKSLIVGSLLRRHSNAESRDWTGGRVGGRTRTRSSGASWAARRPAAFTCHWGEWRWSLTWGLTGVSAGSGEGSANRCDKHGCSPADGGRG